MNIRGITRHFLMTYIFLLNCYLNLFPVVNAKELKEIILVTQIEFLIGSKFKKY